MGHLLEPRGWCRQRWCREDPGAGHQPGDGCSCHAHEAETGPAVAEPIAAEAEPVVPAAEPLHPLRLTSRAWRLDAFACRSCGVKTRNMVEYPRLFLRCEPCAALDRWPSTWSGRVPNA
jgi:hypothetical protein